MVANVHISKREKMMKPADFMIRTEKENKQYESFKSDQQEKKKTQDLMAFMMGINNGK